jgi:hypothetical protein
MANPKLIYPEAEDCPAKVAEAIYRVHYGESTHKDILLIKSFWGTVDYLLQAVDYVYRTNFWPLDKKTKKIFRDIFAGTFSAHKP